MGPSYSEQTVDELYEKVMALLKEHYIQNSPPPPAILVDYTKDREVRNADLKEAIRGLVELQSWEDF